MSLDSAGGIDWNQMIDIINDSIVATPMINFRAELLKEKQFSPAFTAAQMAKDFDIILETGKAVNTPMPITSVVRGSLGIIKAQGKGNREKY
jgi:3-hydroxyisobutyrate dehydrogenase-like beta-hydroxyacid dehydrogenase